MGRNKKLNMKLVNIITLATIAHGFGINPFDKDLNGNKRNGYNQYMNNLSMQNEMDPFLSFEKRSFGRPAWKRVYNPAMMKKIITKGSQNPALVRFARQLTMKYISK